MVLFVQLVYMASSDLRFYSEKKELQQYYHGELCDVMGHYETRRWILLISYVLAVFLKVYNSHYYYFLDVHIEARQENCRVEKIIKKRYFNFFS